ncbi:unnamed protein product [Macrosiphum euphorbiae]|uniref:Uncharacterized protein n=1 Tax=Macrosiphum euphorbiae TaxID=13131 RepID=A0AAV0WIE4_9HEMI|nr:unnamed protein product [Macrosiphum euphorbiae]
MTHLNTAVSELQPSINTSHSPMTTSSYTHGFDDLNPKLIEVLNNLYRENITTNLMLNRVLYKWIQSDRESNPKLFRFCFKIESFLKSVGGTNPKNHLNRVLAKV